MNSDNFLEISIVTIPQFRRGKLLAAAGTSQPDHRVFSHGKRLLTVALVVGLQIAVGGFGERHAVAQST